MYIANDCHWTSYVYDVALLHQQFFRLCAYCFYDQFVEEFLLVQPFDALIEVDGCYIKYQLLFSSVLYL